MSRDELRVIRKEAGLSLEDVSEIGLTRQTLSGIEKGEADVGISVLQKLAEKYEYELVVCLRKRIGSRTLYVDLLGEVSEGDS